MFNPPLNSHRAGKSSPKILLWGVVLFIILALSNPNKEDFVKYKVNNINKHALLQGDLAAGVTRLIGSPIIASTTVRKNRLFFSVFTSPDQSKYLGLFKTVFIEL